MQKLIFVFSAQSFYYGIVKYQVSFKQDVSGFGNYLSQYSTLLKY